MQNQPFQLPFGIQNLNVLYNLSAPELLEETLANKEGCLSENGALVVSTGKFTGRSPKDRYIVQDAETKNTVDWGDVNQPLSKQVFDRLLQKMVKHLNRKDKLYVRNMYAGSDKTYRYKVCFINTLAWHNKFCSNMFIQPEIYKLNDFEPNFTVICCPDFYAMPEKDGVRSSNFSILNLQQKIILIAGTEYSGEMKKGVFSALNYLLPIKHRVLPMHCSANVGKDNHDVSLFFGLSGTGKTTLSADPNRLLIGDDEHGWSQSNVYNFEGGCYAKVIKLSRENEPDIWDAITYGAILENTVFQPNTRLVDYEDSSVTENTRVSYSIATLRNALDPSIGGIPKNVFFLTCDAFGVIPPIQRLSKAQAMYHFISGYTSKVAGTEAGITEPVPVFSACFGAPFMPLHPTTYAKMLGEKLEQHDIKIWLVNTGWTGGRYGVGKRIELKYTREMITSALSGVLDNVGYRTHSILGTEIPMTCPNVPNKILSPRETWQDDEKFYKQAHELVAKFTVNFKKFADVADDEIISGGPSKNANYK